MGTGEPPRYGHPKDRLTALKSHPNIDGRQISPCAKGKFYGQAERAISNGKLHPLPGFHIRPINVVVFHGPS